MGNAPEFCSTLGMVDHQTTSGLGWVQQETVSVVQVSTFVKIKISNTQGNRPFPKKKRQLGLNFSLGKFSKAKKTGLITGLSSPLSDIYLKNNKSQ